MNESELKTLLEVAEKMQAKAPGPWFTDIDDAEECGPHSHSGLSKVESGSSGADWIIARLCETTEANYIAAFDPTTCAALVREVLRLRGLIDTPHTDDFMKAVPLEAAHQVKRWGVQHDRGKSPLDWFWLVGYLAQKATTAALAGDTEKAKHHTISTAAVMLNWFRRLVNDETTFQPGVDADHHADVAALEHP